MRFSADKLNALRRARGLPLKLLLDKAGISRTAYYHIVGKSTLLPRSVTAIARALGVKPSTLLEEENPAVEKVKRIAAMTEKLVAQDPSLDADNVRHTLILLEEPPIERLRRGLIRGRKPDIHG